MGHQICMNEAPKPSGFNPQAAETVKQQRGFPTGVSRGVSRGFVFLVVFLFRDETLWRVSTKMRGYPQGNQHIPPEENENHRLKSAKREGRSGDLIVPWRVASDYWTLILWLEVSFPWLGLDKLGWKALFQVGFQKWHVRKVSSWQCSKLPSYFQGFWQAIIGNHTVSSNLMKDNKGFQDQDVLLILSLLLNCVTLPWN